ncbi:MAG: histidine kinase [Phycisphaerales bacterium]|nr:histidine kinase [Phycisphaerales bacterium]MDB5302033.1 histidine kinase [Phycisphaerales bacterium]MDB5305087.1 histidine kinase [Phycisphaerales bacterium]
MADQQQSPQQPVLEPAVHAAHLELAGALHSRIGEILLVWEGRVRKAFPTMTDASFGGLAKQLPALLDQIAAAIGSQDAAEARKLVEISPAQGVLRLEQERPVRDVMLEDRLLRSVVIEEIADALGRPMTTAEQGALHNALDIMSQTAVVAYVEGQERQTRAATDLEAKYLSYLSHDLRNHLSGVTIWLKLLRQQLHASPASSEAVTTLDVVQRSIGETVAGIERLLHSEKLRRQREQVRSEPVDLHLLASDVLRQYAEPAREKGLGLAVDVTPGMEVRSDREIIGLVLNNLVGNAVKYSRAGVVRIGCQAREKDGGKRWALFVSDEGPGIATEHLVQIFDSFRRGDSHGQPGLGLGLAIASQAAKVLGAQLAVESQLGKGSVFWLTLPPSEGS